MIEEDTESVRSGTYSADLQPLDFDARSRVQINDVTNFDHDQFEKYLVRPDYVKLLKKQADCDILPFKRLFLAQELQLGGSSVTVSRFSKDGTLFCVGCKDGSLMVLKVLQTKSEKLGISDAECEETGKRKIQYAPIFNELDIVSLNSDEKVHREVLDLSWSVNHFLLVSSVDSYVTLWTPFDGNRPIMRFDHPDLVTSAKFIEADDRFFISGCLDHCVRFWSVTDNRVEYSFNCEEPINVVTVSPGMSHFTVVGTFGGYIYVFSTMGLKLIDKFHIINGRSIDGNLRNGTDRIKITGIEWIVTDNRLDEIQEDNEYSTARIVVTSGDERIRVFKLTEGGYHNLELKGFHCEQFRHRAQLCIWDDKPFIYCSSEDQWFYVWRLNYQDLMLTRATNEILYASTTHRRRRTERILGHTKEVTSSVLDMFFSTYAAADVEMGSNDKGMRHGQQQSMTFSHESTVTQTMPIGQPTGSTTKSTIEEQREENYILRHSHTFSFHAHDHPITTVNIAPIGTIAAVTQSNDFIYEFTCRCYSNNVELRDVEMDSCDIIGPIVVTTDSVGKLRVFRTDLSDIARETLINVLHSAIETKQSTF